VGSFWEELRTWFLADPLRKLVLVVVVAVLAVVGIYVAMRLRSAVYHIG
jgi:hypothetical protein